jgi:hypothetical protein
MVSFSKLRIHGLIAKQSNAVPIGRDKGAIAIDE